MKRKLIIDGNAVYEIDEDCMVRKCLKQEAETETLLQQQREKLTGRKKTIRRN